MKASAMYGGAKITPTVTAAKFIDIKAGNYNVKFTLNKNGGISKTVKLTVVKDGSVVSPDNTASVYAQNTIIKSTDAKL